MIVFSVLNCSISPLKSISQRTKQCKYTIFHTKVRTKPTTIRVFLSKSLFSLFISYIFDTKANTSKSLFREKHD